MERGNHCSFSIGHMVSKVASEAQEFHESGVLNHHAWKGRGSKFVCSTILLSVAVENRYRNWRLVYQTASLLRGGRKQFLDSIQSIPDGAQLYFYPGAVFSIS
jgi:hypothetical protein